MGILIFPRVTKIMDARTAHCTQPDSVNLYFIPCYFISYPYCNHNFQFSPYLSCLVTPVSSSFHPRLSFYWHSNKVMYVCTRQIFAILRTTVTWHVTYRNLMPLKIRTMRSFCVPNFVSFWFPQAKNIMNNLFLYLNTLTHALSYSR